MEIDIDKLTEPELIELNNRIVARLDFLGAMRAHAAMLQFRIGDRVSFQPAGQVPVAGMVTRYNKKTVTVITSDGRHWNVSAAGHQPHELQSSPTAQTPDATRDPDHNRARSRPPSCPDASLFEAARRRHHRIHGCVVSH